MLNNIADWERRLLECAKASPDDKMSDSDRIMCLEDMCPEAMQRYLPEKAPNGQIRKYNDYKDAIDQYYYDEKRWSKSHRQKVHLINEENATTPRPTRTRARSARNPRFRQSFKWMINGLRISSGR